jgi:hypothetical protein
MHFPLPISTGVGLLLAALASTLIIASARTGADGSSRADQSHAPGQTAALHEARTVKINIKVKDRVVSAMLNHSKVAQDFASLLPLSLTLSDYASTEKISDLPKRLSTEGAPPGFDPSAGDIAYYAPWGNLAIIDTPMVAGMLVSEEAVMKEMMKDVPIRRLGRADEIADAVLWLCSPGSTFVIGHALAVDGGYTAR